MGLRGFENAFPKTLSGGMKQRVALARAYAVKSQFLLMDEPFGVLDAQTRSAMHDLLLHALEEEGKTVLLITHSVEEALYLSSRIVVATARPTRIDRIIDVPFPYPRRPGLHREPEFAALQHEIHELLMRQYAQQQKLLARRPTTTTNPADTKRRPDMATLNRRSFNKALAATAIAGAPAILRAQTRKLRIGYLHVLSVDAHMWLAQHLGTWKKEGLDVELREFNTGVELFQAMIGGSIDVLTTGGVLSNFPARGQGRSFSSTTCSGPMTVLDQHEVRHQQHRRPEGQEDRHHARHDGAQPAASGAQECWPRFTQRRRDREPADARRDHGADIRGRSSGCHMGPLQCGNQEQAADGEDAIRRFAVPQCGNR